MSHGRTKAFFKELRLTFTLNSPAWILSPRPRLNKPIISLSGLVRFTFQILSCHFSLASSPDTLCAGRMQHYHNLFLLKTVFERACNYKLWWYLVIDIPNFFELLPRLLSKTTTLGCSYYSRAAIIEHYRNVEKEIINYVYKLCIVLKV